MIRSPLDTALWTAACRAHETARPDALFHDPLAARLAGLRGPVLLDAAERIAPAAASNAVRTRVFDDIILQSIAGGIDTVISLGAGLDARPYRLALPPSLRWFEVDRPEVIFYKEAHLRSETPRCVVERFKLDIGNVPSLLVLRRRLAPAARRALIVTEGCLLYLSPDQVGALTAALHQESAFRYWLTDLAAPELVARLAPLWSPFFGASLAFRFAPAEGAAWFGARGYRPNEQRSTWADLIRFGRVPPGSPTVPLTTTGEPDIPTALSRLASVVLLERIAKLV